MGGGADTRPGGDMFLLRVKTIDPFVNRSIILLRAERRTHFATVSVRGYQPVAYTNQTPQKTSYMNRNNVFFL